MGCEVINCNCHRVNSAVLWSLGISGAAASCKNKAMGKLIKKLAACVGFISYSAVNNDLLKGLQELEEDLHRIYELNKRNDTRWFVFKILFLYCAFHLELCGGTRLCCSCNARNIFIFLYSVFVFQSLIIKVQF